jgi:FHS family L-fucose permease-like MFS transporter
MSSESKGNFSQSNLEAQLSAFAFCIACGAVSLPAALLVARLCAIRGICSDRA